MCAGGIPSDRHVLGMFWEHQGELAWLEQNELEKEVADEILTRAREYCRGHGVRFGK